MKDSKRRKFKADFKAQVAMEAVKERKTPAQLAQQFNLHPHQISTWKGLLLSSATGIFQESSKGQEEKQAFDEERSRLCEQMDRRPGSASYRWNWSGSKKNISASRSRKTGLCGVVREALFA